MLFAAMVCNVDCPFLHLSFVDSTCIMHVSILSKVDPEVSEAVLAFHDVSSEGGCWHLSCYFVVEGAPHAEGLDRALIDF